MTFYFNRIESIEDKKLSSLVIKAQKNKGGFFGFQMNKFNMLIAFSAVLFLCVSTLQAAPAEVYQTTSELTQQSTQTTTPRQIKICTGMAPCGWAVYTPATKRVDFFVKNTCYCSLDKACMRAEDHLSVGAYVYRCVDKPTTTTTSESLLEETQT